MRIEPMGHTHTEKGDRQTEFLTIFQLDGFPSPSPHSLYVEHYGDDAPVSTFSGPGRFFLSLSLRS